ncbi:S1-like domain-containing RNA-binding protein [Neobacillus novalis]|uniref:S1-like domain-containing RNA-binding protein n=1 Tax=Neobacillus novalis TaxID=220687 RepID=A0AA95SDL9_9BACI|nr:S1-like domain-containing RNA-binding protein [Neobacillus novalis]WHY88979.1 S1-like domain-containing RNA-binding protein [Neobacillus novalis]
MSLQELIGQSTTLTVARKATFGYFLTDGNEDVLLHINQADQEFQEEDQVEVFLYVDSEGRISASTTIPEIAVGRYGWVKVTDTNPKIGVFLNIGLPKDILLGIDDLPTHKSVWPKPGDLVYITLKLSRNYLLYAKLASDPIIESISVKATRENFNKNVQGHIYRTAKVGSWIYTIEGFKGFIHESQRPQEPRLGEMVEGRIIDIKEDGTVNISLLARKEESQDQDAERIYEYLLSRDGSMPFSDKSMPEEIQERFNLSKGAFKRALGKLMKEGKAYQEGSWTYVKKD